MPDFLLRYADVDSAVVRVVTSILLARGEAGDQTGFALSGLFNGHSEVGERLAEFFVDDPTLLRRAYVAAHAVRDALDHDSVALSQIIDIDPHFLRAYIHWMATERGPVARHDDHRDYDLLWRRDDYEALMLDAVDAVYDAERDSFTWSTHLAAFFRNKSEGESDAEVVQRQDSLLELLIGQRHTDAEFMTWLFHVVAQLPEERRRAHILRLLERNHDFALFERLPLEPNGWSWWGSEVPVLRRRIEFLDSLLPSLQGLAFLDHKLEVQRRMKWLEERVEEAKRRDFKEL